MQGRQFLIGTIGGRRWDMETTSIYQGLDDERDRTVYIEYYPWAILTTVWRENGTVDSCYAARNA